MKEAIFTTEIMTTLKRAGYYAHKLSDAPVTPAVMFATRFTPGKPCDIVAGIEGLFVAIETKQIRKRQSFSMKDMRPSQIKGLTEIIEKGNKAFVFLNVRLRPDPSKKQPRENRLVVWEWTWLKARLSESNIKYAEIEKMPHTTKSPDTQTKKGVFDLSLFHTVLQNVTIDDF